jgi:pimeloyl-ACP methyl ester carboxylesterase
MLLHSGPQHWYAWRHVIPQLAPHFRLICPDLRGFGWSDVPRRATTGGSGTWPMTVLTTLLLAPGAN